MALSLGFGVVFATVITLLLVPALYMVIEDGCALFGLRSRGRIPEMKPSAAAQMPSEMEPSGMP